MKLHLTLTVLTVVALSALGALAIAADQPAGTKAPAQQAIRGPQLMTPEEWAAHREKMWSLKTPEERAKYREEHHKLMQERTKELGVTLPDRTLGPGYGRRGGWGGRGFCPRARV
jgi:hypothetical protein